MVLAFFYFILFLEKGYRKSKRPLGPLFSLSLLPLIPILVSLILEFRQAAFHFLPKIGDLFYPAGGKVYTEFLPFLLGELKKILSDPSYTIPYD